ncbi:hypothetical protein SAMN05428939_1664 [Streptomyces sp. TLI_105]|nr:hypothetical protein SAMN05428939_1664 [Streptomyces sp. TLI_105]
MRVTSSTCLQPAAPRTHAGGPLGRGRRGPRAVPKEAYGLDDADIAALRGRALEQADDLATRLLEESDAPGIDWCGAVGRPLRAAPHRTSQALLASADSATGSSE